MDYTATGLTNSLFKANQIICLEYQDNCLYGEVIQLVPQRKLCWFRPICLVSSSSQDGSWQNRKVINLRSSSDLLWPTILFRPALDVEVISFLTELKDTDGSLDKISKRQYLNKFIQLVWQNNQDKF